MALPFDAKTLTTPDNAADFRVSALSPEQEAAIVADRLKPGNLIYGDEWISKWLWLSFVTRGILTPEAANIATRAPGADSICFGMLPDGEEDRVSAYNWASHDGPRYDHSKRQRAITPRDVLARIGYVVSRERLLKHHKNKLVAVGSYFTGSTYRFRLEDYHFDEVTATVFGIPIQDCDSSSDPFYPPYGSEVRLVGDGEGDVEAADSFFWDGVIVDSSDAELLQEWTRAEGLRLKIPLLSSAGKVCALEIG